MVKELPEFKAKKETTEIPEPEGLKQLRESFAKIYDGPDSLRRTYDMVEEAKCLNLPLDTYRYLYEQRSEEPLPAYPKCSKRSKFWKIPTVWLGWFRSPSMKATQS